ncbi:MAG: 5'-methylthioadenosine phosphorylase [Armatimonadota bacterium]|nr:5'-methylthioadenosine phosphorylase [Armatimonadota bacterium]
MAEQTVPRTPFALISGSAGWGLRFPDDLREPGVRVVERGLSFETPWGQTENWQVIECDGSTTPDGKARVVLNVFAHGWPLGAVDHAVHRRVFWVLDQAGVRKVLSDSTCGSLNRALQPRDFVICSDVLDFTQTPYSTLPGRFKYLCRGAQMFCPSLGRILEQTARELWPSTARVYGLHNRLIMAHTWGPRFETPAEARALQALGADAVNQSIAPESTNAREIGACFISASYVTDFVDGIIPEEWGELDAIHDELGAVAARISLRAIARADLTDECGCRAYRMVRPGKYAIVGQR